VEELAFRGFLFVGLLDVQRRWGGVVRAFMFGFDGVLRHRFRPVQCPARLDRSSHGSVLPASVHFATALSLSLGRIAGIDSGEWHLITIDSVMAGAVGRFGGVRVRSRWRALVGLFIASPQVIIESNDALGDRVVWWTAVADPSLKT